LTSGRGSRADNLNCVDLFAGAGGFSLAARKAGLTVRLAVESDRHAASTYRRNLVGRSKRLRIVEGDIRSVDPTTLAAEHLGEDRCHLLLGGPPCQGFSTHRINGAGVDDERNDLIHVYFDFVRALSPDAFLMENVPGMLWPRHAAAMKRFYDEGRGAGYDVRDPAVLDARDFGLPQRRRRVFILGIRRDVDSSGLLWPPAPTHGNPADRRADPSLLPWTACESAFAEAPAGDPNDVHMKHSEELVRAFERTPANGGSRQASGRQLACHVGHDGHNDVYGRIDPRGAAPTMTTACINPSKGRFVHPTLHHGITVRQAARIQTFPDDFVFEGGLMAAGKQVGNAVPVDLAAMLIRQVKPVLGGGVPSRARQVSR
jgi:DNA (cytosine-5)-methyltransferase 1